MRLIIENIDDAIGQQIIDSAKIHQRTVEQEVKFVLSEKFSRDALVGRLKKIHAKILEERGGVPFSDSVQIIREMRDND